MGWRGVQLLLKPVDTFLLKLEDQLFCLIVSEWVAWAQLPPRLCWPQRRGNHGAKSHTLLLQNLGRSSASHWACGYLGGGSWSSDPFSLIARWEWRLGLPLDLPDATLAGEWEQCLLPLERSAPHSAQPTPPRQGHQSINCFHWAGDERSAPTQSHRLHPNRQEKQSTTICFHGVGDRRWMENQLPVWFHWKQRKPGSFSVGVGWSRAGIAKKDFLLLSHPFPDPLALEKAFSWSFSVCACWQFQFGGNDLSGTRERQ